MAEIIVIRRGGALIPTDDAGLEAMRALKEGEAAMVTLTKSRNIRFHRLFFGLLNKVAQNSVYSPEELLGVVKLATGHYLPVKLPDGTIIRIPGSISFAKMDEPAFRQFWERAV